MHESDKYYATVIVLKGTRREIHFIMETLLIFKKVLSKNRIVEIGLIRPSSDVTDSLFDDVASKLIQILTCPTFKANLYPFQ